MAYDYRNLAYDLRLFEEEDVYSSSVKTPEKKQAKKSQKEKLNKDVEPVKTDEKTNHKRIKRRKNNFLNIALSVGFAVIVAVVVSLIIHGQVQLTELNQQISSAKSDLEEQQSLYTQLEMKVDASISTSVVEKYAEENLGMTKVANSQKEFVSLSKGDKVELTMEENDTIFDAIVNAISSLWS